MTQKIDKKVTDAAPELLEVLEGLAEYVKGLPVAQEDQDLQNHLMNAATITMFARGDL